MGIRTCYLCQQAGHTSRECPRKNGDSETDPSHTNENNKKGNNPTQNKKQKQVHIFFCSHKQVHIDTENIQKITTQKNSATTITTPANNEQGHNNNNHQSQESIDVESLTNSQLREINAVQTVVSQQISTDNSKPIETLNEEDNTDDEEDADYCTEDDQMSTESDDSHAEDTNDQISDDEIEDIELNKAMNYPSLPSSYNSIHAEAQRNYVFGTRSQSLQMTTSTGIQNKTTIADSQTSESDHDMML
jgi:hypothetical protein